MPGHSAFPIHTSAIVTTTKAMIRAVFTHQDMLVFTPSLLQRNDNRMTIDTESDYLPAFSREELRHGERGRG